MKIPSFEVARYYFRTLILASLLLSSEPRVLPEEGQGPLASLPTSLPERKSLSHSPAVVLSVLRGTPGLCYMSISLDSLRRWGGRRECAEQILPWTQGIPQPTTKAGEIASQWPPLVTDWGRGGRERFPREEGNSPQLVRVSVYCTRCQSWLGPSRFCDLGSP